MVQKLYDAVQFPSSVSDWYDKNTLNIWQSLAVVDLC